MSAISEIIVYSRPHEVHSYLKEHLSHVETVSEDVFEGPGMYVAVTVYQQYFMRVGNRAALTVIVSGSQDSDSTRVKTVATGSSRDFIIDFDWGAAGAFAYEPIELLKRGFRTSEP